MTGSVESYRPSEYTETHPENENKKRQEQRESVANQWRIQRFELHKEIKIKRECMGSQSKKVWQATEVSNATGKRVVVY